MHCDAHMTIIVVQPKSSGPTCTHTFNHRNYSLFEARTIQQKKYVNRNKTQRQKENFKYIATNEGLYE